MATITIRVSEEEKEWLKQMAVFNGLSVSELVKKYSLEELEDQYDLISAESSLKSFEENGKKAKPLSEMMKDFDI